jgi:two-component system, cell cycle sensor histidine kinase and response regulator CckA
MLPDTSSALTARAERMDALLRDLYAAAVELNLPQCLIDRIWAEIGYGGALAFSYDELPALIDRPAPVELRMPQHQALEPHDRKIAMVVDDDPMMLDVLTRILMRDNYELITAADGAEAVAKAAVCDSIDLLVTDCMMPGLNGPAVADQVRARFPQLAVLYQTGFSDVLFADRQELGDHEAFLEKPFSARGLVEAARLVLFGHIADAPKRA